jgi:hypothetical protein
MQSELREGLLSKDYVIAAFDNTSIVGLNQ